MNIFGQIVGTIILTGIAVVQTIVAVQAHKERKELEKSIKSKKNNLKKV